MYSLGEEKQLPRLVFSSVTMEIFKDSFFKIQTMSPEPEVFPLYFYFTLFLREVGDSDIISMFNLYFIIKCEVTESNSKKS